MEPTVLVGASVRTNATPELADWLLIKDGLVVTAGTGDPPAGIRHERFAGGVLIPAFCDAHVHLGATGLEQRGVDLSSCTRADEVVATLRAHVESGGLAYGIRLGDLAQPLTARELDLAVGRRRAIVTRADLHSCAVSSEVLSSLELDGVEGVERDADGRPNGFLRETAAAHAWRWFDASLSATEVDAAVDAAAALALARGVAAVHEMYVVEWKGWDGFGAILAAKERHGLGIEVYVASDDVARVGDLKLGRIGGDWFLDGSFGSYTAWMHEPYEDSPPGVAARGMSYHRDEEVTSFFLAAHDARLQVGVHAIGDAAIDQALRGWEHVAAERGVDAVRARRNRIEHFECAGDDAIARAAKLGIAVSIQPAFDRFWGGPAGLYAARIGRDRSASMNRFASMLDAGLMLGVGSDTPVTPLDPMLQMAALRLHHDESQQLDGRAALDLHTRGSFHLGGNDRAGRLAPGYEAHLAWVDRDPVTSPAEDLQEIEVRATWISGRRVWRAGER